MVRAEEPGRSEERRGGDTDSAKPAQIDSSSERHDSIDELKETILLLCACASSLERTVNEQNDLAQCLAKQHMVSKTTYGAHPDCDGRPQ